MIMNARFYGESSVSDSENVGPSPFLAACLSLANSRPGDDAIKSLRDYGLIRTNSNAGGRLLEESLDPENLSLLIEALGDEGQFAAERITGLATRLRRKLDQMLKSGDEPSAALLASLDSALDDVAVPTKLELSQGGKVLHIHRYRPKNDDGVIALCQAFLLDPDLGYRGSLRKCPWTDCQRFFLALKNSKGGPRRKYCSANCQLKGDAAKRPERARARRKQPARHK